jgi:hypothetical protein
MAGDEHRVQAEHDELDRGPPGEPDGGRHRPPRARRGQARVRVNSVLPNNVNTPMFMNEGLFTGIELPIDAGALLK